VRNSGNREHHRLDALMGSVAILSYHGWEIAPARLAADVASLRRDGWRDCSLADLEAMAAGARRCHGKYFHVTLDDGAEGDLACMDVLARASCPATFFLSLGIMSDSALAAYRRVLAGPLTGGLTVGDHSLRHQRTFHSRHVVGFHSAEAPLMTSPERLGLQPGDPVCTYGGELVRPRFMPDPRAVDVCREAAGRIAETPGTGKWTAAIADRLLASGLASRRLGRLCLRGRYETREEFRTRMVPYLIEGRDRLAGFIGSAPTAFAHPWWMHGPAADRELQALGYRVTFSGLGLWDGRGALAIPRIFVSNDTARPLAPEQIDTVARAQSSSWASVRELGRRLLWA
jgi:hypothetical protein